MGPASRNLRQVITYWAPGGNTDWGSQSFAAPVKISGRWTEGQQTVENAGGEEVVSKAIVYVSQDVAQRGYLALGDYFSIPVSDPTTVPDASEIQAFRATPDLRNLEQERKAFL